MRSISGGDNKHTCLGSTSLKLPRFILKLWTARNKLNFATIAINDNSPSFSIMMLIEKSLTIALRAYAGKTDKAGREYIHHPLRLMAKMTTDSEMAVALLHDVIEDSDITAAELLAVGVPNEVVEAVLCLTKQAGENYADFIRRAKQNALARKVKLADIEDNINVLRLSTLTEKDLARIVKYHAAWQVLNNAD